MAGLLQALGGLGLFLLGMTTMTNGLKSLAGAALRRALARFTRSPSSGAATGAITTALIQSSSATTVTAVGFVGAGLLTFPQALGIIFGANMGTTITGWFVALFGFKLKIDLFALPLVLLGVLMHLFGKGRTGSIGLAVAGFGLLFVGMEVLKDGMAAFEGVVTPQSFPPDTIPGRLLLVLIGVVITLVTQSSSAGVATALAAVNANTISFPQAAAMVIGMDVGTTVTAAIATIGGSTDARRTGFAHVIYNVITAVGAFLLLTPYSWACAKFAPEAFPENPEIALVGFHTLFNTLGVLLVLPFSNQFARMIERLVPDRPVKFTQRLDPTMLKNPAVALQAVSATLIEIAEFVLADLRIMLSEAVDDRPDDSMVVAREALARTREFLIAIDTTQDHELSSERHLSAIHAIDHLRRLVRRCQETRLADRARESQSLDDYQGQALQLVITALAELSIPPDEAGEDVITKKSWKRLNKQGERLFLGDDASRSKHLVSPDIVSRIENKMGCDAFFA